MDRRNRTIVAVIWIAVAGVMATTLEPGVPSDGTAIARLFVVGLALFLAGVYLFDPWEVVSRKPFN